MKTCRRAERTERDNVSPVFSGSGKAGLPPQGQWISVDRRPLRACGSPPATGSGDSCVTLQWLALCPKTAVAINKQRRELLAQSPALLGTVQ
ncbi:hypothetical protein F2P81_006132 [Scophthalmus maximus]|uniref:Uncharacterized protein n=1 Tax=Scophthalmus maximus TaxID=52904 RepID=A0A6A4TFR5_SCOMX|nr:hypothetical protein F2P81_006132 [Scophthalmus maximus]